MRVIATLFFSAARLIAALSKKTDPSSKLLFAHLQIPIVTNNYQDIPLRFRQAMTIA